LHNFVCGWLDLNGEFHICGEYEHISLADELENKLGLKIYDRENFKLFHGEHLLEKLGWVKFTQAEFYKEYDSYPDKGYVFFLWSEHQLTRGQTDWLLDNMLTFSPSQIKMIEDIFRNQMDFWNR